MGSTLQLNEHQVLRKQNTAKPRTTKPCISRAGGKGRSAQETAEAEEHGWEAGRREK